VNGLRPDSISDSHLALLDLSNLRSLTIESIKFSPANKCLSLLQIGDETLKKFLVRKNFPRLRLEKCRITAKMVCQYMEKWLAKESLAHNNNLPSIQSHLFVLKECPAVNNLQFERECRRRSLGCEQSDANNSSNNNALPVSSSSNDSGLVSYNIHQESIKEFLVTLSSSPTGENGAAEFTDSNKDLSNNVIVGS